MDSSQYDSALESSQNESTLDTSWNKPEEKQVEEKLVDEHHADTVPTHFVGHPESSVSLVNKDISAAELLESTERAEPVVVPILQPAAVLELATTDPSTVEEPVGEPPVTQEPADVQPEAEKRKMAKQTPKVQSAEEPAAESVTIVKSIVEQISEEALKTEEASVKTEVLKSYLSDCLSSLASLKVSWILTGSVQWIVVLECSLFRIDHPLMPCTSL